MKKIDMVAIGTIAMVACLLFCTPALANYNFDGFPVVTRTSGTVNGGVFTDSVPWNGQTTLTGNFNVPTGNVIWARLYTGIWGGRPEYEGWVNVTFNGVDDSNGLGPIHLQGQNDTNPNVWCSGSGKYWIYYDVTDLVNKGAVNTATTTKINATVGNFDGRVYGIVLVAVYEDGDNPKDIQYWVNDGSDALNHVTPHDDGTTDFAGTDFAGSVAGSVTEAELTMVHLTAYDPACANCLQFNGAALDTSMVNSNTFELNSWNVASHVESSGNDAWYSRGNDGYVNVCNAILTLISGPEELPDLVVTEVNAYHYDTGTPAWFNLLNEIDVTVKNNGSAGAGASTVCLYIDDVSFGDLPVSSLDVDAEETVTFTGWNPSGDDCLQQPCTYEDSFQDYDVRAVADCDGDVAESNETNNERTVVERACYNGYMADEPLENVAQGTLHGHLIFTTGDGSYECLNSPDDTQATNYVITLPESATVEHAQLNVYYTWVSPDHACPEMEVSITNPTGTHVVPLEKAYNDIKCTCPGTMYVKSWGNYVFDIAPYVTGSGIYTVTVKNVGLSGHKFCLAAPGIVLVYADESAPLIDYWVNKGADLLLGGRRSDGGYLSLEECINDATFSARATTDTVETATLGVVAPWGDNAADDVLYFNGVELGSGVYNGYSNPYSEEIDSITMSVGGSNAQVGVDVTDVTALYNEGSENVVGQGDDGDNMMPANAFLVVAYVEEEEPDLNVSEITVNYDAPDLGGRAVGPVPGQGVYTECNNLSAVIGECNGVDVGAPFDVSFEVDGAMLCTVQVPGLTGGTTKTVYCNCSWYPYAGDDFAIDVTVDSNNEIPETNETDNTKWNNGTAVSNGYKGDGWQGPDRNLINEQCHDQDTINLTYSVGDSEYVSGSTQWTEYTGSWTTTDLPVPDGAEIEKAMLYVYYTWDKNNVMPDNVAMAFNGNNIALARDYSDSKGFGDYDFPSGMLIYDVRSHFTATGPNNAILTKAVASDVVSMRGMLLMVIYNHPGEPERIIYIDEGYDMLYAKDSYAVTSEEATTYAPFTCCEQIPVDELGKATLIAVAPSASDGDDMNRLSFNDGLWNGIWDHYEAATQLGIAEANVLAYLKPAENRANFQSHIPAGGDKGDFMDASNAFLILEKRPKPDLNVTEITVNYDASSLGGRAIGPVPGDDVYTECNNLSAVIGECNGVAVGSPFDVTFEVDGTTLCTVNVPSLTGGSTKTVYCNCSWYPYAGDVFAIDVTVDSNNEIPETNETNNTKWNNGTAVSNGYKGDGWQGPDKNLINEQCHEQDTINLTYSVGDSEYVSGSTQWTEYTGSWTTTDLPVPAGAEIEKAMLYVYYTWDKNNVMPDNVAMAFNGNNIALARDYSDSKGFGDYDFPSGMLIYDVRSHFTATGTNSAILTKAVAADVVSMRGMLLMVIYKHPDEPERIICIDEGYDMLYAKDSYAVTSEEATTYAPFTCCEQIPVDELGKATLIAVAPSASDGDDMNRLSFNDGLWNGIWDHYEAATQLGIAEANVLAYLKPAENRANFQSHIPAGGDKGDFMDASNAFLILEKRPKPDLNVTEITVNYDASSLGGRAIGPVPGDDVYTECNNLSAVIGECNGVAVGSPFDVTFEVDGTTLCTVNVPSLTGGSTKTVYCNCSWYPYAGDVFAIDVTVDSNNEIPETNETNNTKWNNGTAVSNGYKGDGWQGPDKNLINEQCHEQDTINLTYSVGDSEYVSGSTQWTEYTSSWTTTDLPVPAGAEIEKAMLYVYYTWDKNNVMPDNVAMAFNGNNIALARDYSDSKGFGDYDFPSGMLIYDVRSHFTATGTNSAILTKAVAADVVSMRGMLLMVIYKHPDEPERIICIDEGYDMLYAKDSYAVTSEEATTYAPFTCCEQISVDELGKATLIAVAPSASDGDDMNRLSFNDGLWNGIWDHYEAATQLGIAEANVLAYLKPAENRANFQSHIPAGGDKGDFMDASNAFLILEKKGEIPCPAKYAVYQANVRDPEGRLNDLRALRDNKLEDGYVTRYYEYSPALTMVLSRADSDLVKEGAQLVSKYSIPVGLHVQGMDVDERITRQDVEEALSFTDRLKSEVMNNRDAIGAKSTEAIIVFIDEFEGQVTASEGKTFSAALKSSIYYEDERSRVYQEIEKE